MRVTPGWAGIAGLGLTLVLVAGGHCGVPSGGYVMDSNASVKGNEPDLPTDLAQALAQALAAKGPDYVPRTEHLTEDGRPLFVNRLILETSPYLLQHAHNPVSWSPWSDDAFARAREQHKLVLLSVGYSTCHWCHVMERESFEDLEIADFISRHFVPIKVDREERPDVDAVYMTAVHLMTGRGGWPMTVVLTPEREPVFAGTYFPARDGDRGASIGFLTILRELASVWEAEPKRFRRAAAQVTQQIRAATETNRVSDHAPGSEAIMRGVTYLSHTFDATWGGFGDAPKFPRTVTLELLGRAYRRTGDERLRKMLEHTLDKMAAGGIYDHVGGGFHRYSVDRRWLVPHFEKMLYDNAQLAVAYLEGFQLTGREDFARVTREILDYVRREMTHELGGFFSATDADSANPDGELEEGWFFTWTTAEVEEVVGSQRARLVAAYYDVSEAGNFEGRNILHVSKPLAVVAKMLQMDEETLSEELAAARAALYEARQGRSPPLCDRKVLAAWNGLMISALSRAGHVLDDGVFVEAAVRAADFILEHMVVDGVLMRNWKDGAARHRGYLDDHAFMIQGLLDLYEATGTPRWFQAALGLQRELDTQFADREHGSYFFTSDGHESLLARERPDYDGAEPAGTSVAALNLLRLEQFTDNHAFRVSAERLFAAHAATLAQGVALPKM
ncbi:thioredoxin domain-containing protein, partial [Myxococcota bacterium]